ncbi:MAG: Hsp70 family protein [Planctomycetaceae bacterium]|nr:Hsp70 family protein [Planctomycetaceae bacterium]
MTDYVVGIDLGTTNSVVAVPGVFDEAGSAFGEFTALADAFSRLTQASAVCRLDGEDVVGDDARDLACRGLTPIRFVKKYMGTTKTFRLGDRELTAVEVSALILRHMVDVAQRALKSETPIRRVIITHPAYFDVPAIKDTREAGRLAGLEVVALLEEPTAAALAFYKCGEPVETGKNHILVFDLGGGTFDVTVLEQVGDSYTRLKCGGNRELGGYNIDKKIAALMLADLQAKKYKIHIDREWPERDTRWTTLMFYAEKLKKKLGDGAPKGDAVEANIFEDDSTPPRSVQLRFSMTQSAFRELIKPEIDQTINETKRVIAAANLTPQDLGHLVLVGGSCRLKALQDRLHEEFGLPLDPDENMLDLSVALGAAVLASTQETREGNVAVGYVPDSVGEASVSISGTVTATPECPAVGGLVVTVTGGKDSPALSATAADGRFLVNVPLNENDENALHLNISAPDGRVIFERDYVVFQIEGTRTNSGGRIPEMLAQSIAVLTTKKLSQLAGEGSLLPCDSTKSFRTAMELTELPITLYQDNVELADVVLSDFDRPIPSRTRVDVNIAVSREYELTATVRVPATGAEKIEKIPMKPVTIPPIDRLRLDFDRVCREYRDALENAPAGPRKTEVGTKGDRLVAEAEHLLAERFPEPFPVYLKIRQLDLLQYELPRGAALSPPKSELLEMIAAARSLLPEALRTRPELADQHYDRTLATVEAEIPRVEQEGNVDEWKQLHGTVQHVLGAINILPPPPPHLMREFLMREIEETIEKVDASRHLPADRKNDLRNKLEEAERVVQGVNLTDEDRARDQFREIYHKYVKPANEQLARPGERKRTSVLEEL